MSCKISNMGSVFSKYRQGVVNLDKTLHAARSEHEKQILALLEDYIKVVGDPDARGEYEMSIAEIEIECGFITHFVHALPSYVMEIGSGDQLHFINLCATEFVPRAFSMNIEGKVEWRIPSFLPKPKKDTDQTGRLCSVYDVLLHPATLRNARNDADFKKLLEETMISRIEEMFKLKTKDKSVKYPRLIFKGPTSYIRLVDGKDAWYFASVKDYRDKLIEKLAIVSPSDDEQLVSFSNEP